MSCYEVNNTPYINKYQAVRPKKTMPAVSACQIAPSYSPSFKAAYPITAQTIQQLPRTELKSSAEQKRYNEIAKLLDKKRKPMLNELLRSGRLLNSDSNDKSDTLTNLHKMTIVPRAQGLDKKVLINDAVETLANPFVITQKFGQIPQNLVPEILQKENSEMFYHAPNGNMLETYKRTGKFSESQPLTPLDLRVKSNCCVAASIEFNIAHRNPAEFARMVERLSSQDLSVEKNLKLRDIADNNIDAIWLLNQFEAKYKMKDWENLTVKLEPDRNAIIRARVQNTYRAPLERSAIDVLMQSTIMNVGSQRTYNSLIDKRTGKYNDDNEGLTNIEKNFAETLAEGKNSVLVTYQIIGEDGKLAGYECELPTMKKHITDSLALGNNVIIGYTYEEPDGTISRNGHEITIVGIEKDANNEEFFVCKDTDSNISTPIKYPVNTLLPNIHHASLSKKVLGKDVEFVENWEQVLNDYKVKNP